MTTAQNHPSAALQVSDDALRTTLLGELKIGRLRARKAIVDIDFVGVSLSKGLLSVGQALEILEADGSLAFTLLDGGAP